MTKLLGLLFLLPALACAVPFNIENIAPGVYVHRGEHKDLSGHYGGDICNLSFIVGNKGGQVQIVL